MSNRRFPFSGSGSGERLKFYPNMKAIIAEKLSQLMITFLITSKLLSKAFIFVCLYISYLNTLLYITALDNNHLHLDRFLSHILSSWSFSHERSVISFGIILT